MKPNRTAYAKQHPAFKPRQRDDILEEDMSRVWTRARMWRIGLGPANDFL